MRYLESTSSRKDKVIWNYPVSQDDLTWTKGIGQTDTSPCDRLVWNKIVSKDKVVWKHIVYRNTLDYKEKRESDKGQNLVE